MAIGIVVAIVPIVRMAITPVTMAIALASACTSAAIAIGTGAIVTGTGKRQSLLDGSGLRAAFFYARELVPVGEAIRLIRLLLCYVLHQDIEVATRRTA